MSDPARARLVRCPNCQNLLPELPSYAVYSCGGCGTVLKAKTRGFAEETASEKSPDKHKNSFDGSDWDAVSSSSKSDKQKLVLESDSYSLDSETIRRNQNLGVDHQIRSGYNEYGGANDGDWYNSEYREQNPSEILRKLDELKDQINRSYPLQENPNENGPFRHRFHNPSCPCFNCHNGTVEYTKKVPPSRGRRCLPIAGGSPFVICHNCFKLLQVPRKVLVLEKTRNKMQCGSCFTILILELVDKKLVISSCEQSHIMNEGSPSFNLSLDDSYDHIQYTEDKESNRVEKFPIQVRLPPPPKGASLQEYFEYSNVYRAADKLEDDGKERNRTEEASLATEIDDSFEYTNSGTSQESGYTTTSREGRSRTSSLFSGFKKSIWDFSKSSHGSDGETINVVVNGHAITDRLVKKAEKLAGPIQPGNYWYDVRAGFWGVMGGPCLGIIPPFIEELNHPLQGDCAGGETGVFVNGRELHPKDFNLLCSRGLPRETNRSYIIEISGRVLDETSGEELESLGCLAPSMLKTKRGFGMKPRKVSA